MRRTLYAISALVSFGAISCAQGLFQGNELNIDSPAASRRVAARFDFDPLPNASIDLPAQWIRAQHDPPARIRPTFPIWNRGVLDPDTAFSGTGSVRLDIEGGSASVLLDPGVIQIFPDADYAIVARVRTEEVEHARARLIARLVDRSGEAIAASEVSSAPIRSDDAWQAVSVRVPGDFPEATSLQIELVLEQPSEDPEFPFKDIEIVRQDYQGSAWFDELTVIQVPRIEAWVEPAGNVFPSDVVPTVSVFIRDLVSEPLEVLFKATDAAGQLVDSESIEFSGGRLEKTWKPSVDRFGWFRVDVSVQRDGVRIGSADTSFIWRQTLREGGSRVSARSGSPFSISVDDIPDAGLDQFGALALNTGIPRVLTDLHGGDEPLDFERIEAIGNLANLLAREGSELGIAIGSLPADVSVVSGSTPVLRAIADGTADGASWIEPLLVDLGHRIRWWRIGSFDETLDGLALSYAEQAHARLRDLVPGAMLELPWSSFDAINESSIRTGVVIAQQIMPGIMPEELPALLSSFSDIADRTGNSSRERAAHTAVFRAPAVSSDGNLLEINDAVLSVLHAWVGFCENGKGPSHGRSVRMDAGWVWQNGRRPQLVPTPASAVYYTLIDMLQDRQAELLERVAPGISGILLTPNSRASGQTDSVAVFWADRDDRSDDVLTLLLQEGAVSAMDVFGNSTVIESETLPNSTVRAHRIDLSDGVVFVRGVDPDLLRFLASVHLDPSRVRSDTEPQEAGLVAQNPWGSAIQGEFFVVEPGGLSVGGRATQDRRWQITPRFGAFSLPAGSATRLPIVFDVSPAVGAGSAPLVIDLDLSSPTIAEFVRIERSIEVGLEHIQMHVVAGYEPGPSGENVMVYAIIENTGSTRKDVTLKVGAPGFAPQRSTSTPVLPGRRLIKAFPFKDGRSLLAGLDVTVGLTLREEGARLRKSIRIDDGG